MPSARPHPLSGPADTTEYRIATQLKRLGVGYQPGQCWLTKHLLPQIQYWDGNPCRENAYSGRSACTELFPWTTHHHKVKTALESWGIPLLEDAEMLREPLKRELARLGINPDSDPPTRPTLLCELRDWIESPLSSIVIPYCPQRTCEDHVEGMRQQAFRIDVESEFEDPRDYAQYEERELEYLALGAGCHEWITFLQEGLANLRLQNLVVGNLLCSRPNTYPLPSMQEATVEPRKKKKSKHLAASWREFSISLYEQLREKNPGATYADAYKRFLIEAEKKRENGYADLPEEAAFISWLSHSKKRRS